MFGGDHRPNARDLVRSSANNPKEETYYEEDEDEWHEEYWAEDYGADADWYEEENFYEDEDEEIPEELEEAMEMTDEAYVSYVESRKRMKELALSRGFYPVVALGPEVEKGGHRGFKGDGGKGFKGKGKSSSKGKGKGKGKAPFRRAPFVRRPMAGLRKPYASSSTSTTATSEKSTLSGSTQQHGPQFKRYRSQAQGIKTVPDEEVTMVEDEPVIEEVKMEEQCFFMTTDKGKAIVDSGATRTIVGEENWKKWLESYDTKHAQPIRSKQVKRNFKFGGGEVLQSLYEVEFEAVVYGQRLPITAAIVPGSTPFLLARPTLEAWGVVHDYRSGKMKIGDSQWFEPERNGRGHYILDLMMYQDDNAIEEAYCQIEPENELGLEALDQVYDHGPFDVWDIEPVMENEIQIDEEQLTVLEDHLETGDDLASRVARRIQENRKLKFLEVYVDQGNLAVHLAKT